MVLEGGFPLPHIIASSLWCATEFQLVPFFFVWILIVFAQLRESGKYEYNQRNIYMRSLCETVRRLKLMCHQHSDVTTILHVTTNNIS